MFCVKYEPNVNHVLTNAYEYPTLIISYTTEVQPHTSTSSPTDQIQLKLSITPLTIKRYFFSLYPAIQLACAFGIQAVDHLF